MTKTTFGVLLALSLGVSCNTGPVADATPDIPAGMSLDASTLDSSPEVNLSAVQGGPNASSQGYFAAPIDWPLVGVHASTLPNGKVLTWASSHPEGTHANEYLVNKTSSAVDLWDPANGSHTRVDNNEQEIFCSGHALNANGQLIVTGGNNGVVPGKNYSGANTAFSFNAFSNTWSRLPNMADGRWYPTTTALANGEVATMGGLNLAGENINKIPEVLQTNNTWRTLSTAELSNQIGLYPWNHLAPNGQLFNSGPGQSMSYLNTNGSGSWSSPINRDNLYRTYGTSVMYDIGKLLVLGGGTNTSQTIDLATNTVAPAASMAASRTFMNATLLPTGNVFVNGGNTDGNGNSDTNSVYSSETWNPKTNAWTTGASATVPRNYHSTALLLPDGRVLTTGSRLCGAGCASNYLNAEIYYPPYLFKKDGSGELATNRPNINSYSSTAKLGAGQKFYLYTPRQTANIARVTLVRMGSTTHAFNMDQRFLELSFRRYNRDWLEVSSPNNPNIAPPGYHMAFVINNAGVPSVGRIIKFN